MKKVFSYLLKIIIVGLVIIVLVLNGNESNEFVRKPMLMYTSQSVALLVLVTLFRLLIDILIDIKKLKRYPSILSYLETIAMGGISITFIIFNFILTPALIVKDKISLIWSFSSVSLHFILPILALINYLFLEERYLIKKHSFLLSGLFSLYYLYLVIICNNFDVIFNDSNSNNRFFPYFFMNYYDNGWFKIGSSIKEVGLFYWTIAIIGVSIALGALYHHVINKRQKRHQQAQIDFLAIKDAS